MHDEAREVDFDPDLARARWLLCLDLLGTRALLAAGKQDEVFDAYSDAIMSLRRDASDFPDVWAAWFSDTFLVVAQDTGGASFQAIEMIGRHFAASLLLHRVPFRAAIACGELYADRNANIIFGQALVEAYECSEAQGWLGLILCPSAVARAVRLGIPMDGRLNWREAAIPWKASRADKYPVRLPAWLMGESSRVNGRNIWLEALREMAADAARCEEKVREKYRLAINFVEQNQRR